MPMGKETVTNLLNEVADDDDLAYLPGKVGSVKRKRLYDRKVVAVAVFLFLSYYDN